MLYLVGGASRSGKSLLAGRMSTRHRVPWFPLDSLKMSLHLGAPAIGVHPNQADLQTADRMWPFVEPILDHMLFEGRDYLIEGVDLRPATVARYIAETDEAVRACFLGYPDASLDDKAGQVEAHRGPPTDWLHRTGATNVRRYLTISRSLSRHLRDECERLGLPFIDTGRDFPNALAAAERALVGPAGS